MKIFFSLLLFLTATVMAACPDVKEVSVEQANAAVTKGNVQFIDVRTVAEYNGGHAAKAVNLPLDELEKGLAGLDREKPVYVICQTGRRSQKGAALLERAGFREVYNVAGGTVAWTSAGLPLEK